MDEAKEVLERAIGHWNAGHATHGPRFTPRTLSTKGPAASGFQGWRIWRKTISTRS
jgi:hypothetical protein